MRNLTGKALALLSLVMVGCAGTESNKQAAGQSAAAARAGSDYAVFRSLPSWETGVYKNRQLLTEATPANTSVQISLKEQRAFLLVNGAIAMDFPVATGRSSHPTPTGRFTIIEKIKDYHSNIYGRTIDAYGNIVLPDADKRTDPIPEGGQFVNATMTYWMRLTSDGVGMHVGYVPGGGRTASHGCVRMQEPNAKMVFDLTRVGTPVVIAEQGPASL